MKYMIIGLFLLFAGNLYAQVRGTVKDSTGRLFQVQMYSG